MINEEHGNEKGKHVEVKGRNMKKLRTQNLEAQNSEPEI